MEYKHCVSALLTLAVTIIIVLFFIILAQDGTINNMIKYNAKYNCEYCIESEENNK